MHEPVAALQGVGDRGGVRQPPSHSRPEAQRLEVWLVEGDSFKPLALRIRPIRGRQEA